MKYAIIALLLVTCIVSSCSPITSVRTIDDRPTLAFIGAPFNAILYIDGLNMGPAGQYDAEPRVLTVEPGTHSVRVVVDSNVIYDQRVFVESSRKTITLR